MDVNIGGPGGGEPLGAAGEFLRPDVVERASKEGVSERAAGRTLFFRLVHGCLPILPASHVTILGQLCFVLTNADINLLPISPSIYGAALFYIWKD